MVGRVRSSPPAALAALGCRWSGRGRTPTGWMRSYLRTRSQLGGGFGARRVTSRLAATALESSPVARFAEYCGALAQRATVDPGGDGSHLVLGQRRAGGLALAERSGDRAARRRWPAAACAAGSCAPSRAAPPAAAGSPAREGTSTRASRASAAQSDRPAAGAARQPRRVRPRGGSRCRRSGRRRWPARRRTPGRRGGGVGRRAVAGGELDLLGWCPEQPASEASAGREVTV